MNELNVLKFICDENAEIPTSTSYETAQCRYETEIYTKYACPTNYPGTCVFSDPFSDHSIDLSSYKKFKI